MSRFTRLAAIVLLMLTACGEQTTEQPASDDSRLSVYSVNYPLHYFARRIGGDEVNAVFPAPAGVDPAYWTPAAETVSAYQNADLILLNGAGYARWVSLATLPEGRMINTSDAFEDQYIELEGKLTHTHGPRGDREGEHSHAGFAFTTWLDMALAKQQARAVADALIAARPGATVGFESRHAELEKDLDALDARLRDVSDRLGDTPVVFSHPVYQYLQRRYDLNGRSVHWEPGTAPTTRQWRELDALIAGHSPHWMIWEAPPTAETLSELEERGIPSLVFSPVANTPETGDFLEAMDANVSALESVATGQ